jgi:ribosomal protein S18 acetylase RimI-like enzyme
MLGAPDVEAIERATFKALPPRRVLEDDGWWLAANGGAIGRCNSVVPLRSGRSSLQDKIERAEAFYEAEGLRPLFRVGDVAQPAGLEAALAARGYAPHQPSLVMTGALADALAALSGAHGASLTATPDEAWTALFVSTAADPLEAVARAATVARGDESLFAQVRLDGEVAAIGTAGVDGDWAGVHGMRTAAAHRRKGLAMAVLAALLGRAGRRGCTRVFLSVEADNDPAIALYRRLGLQERWRYAYWRPA